MRGLGGPELAGSVPRFDLDQARVGGGAGHLHEVRWRIGRLPFHLMLGGCACRALAVPVPAPEAGFIPYRA